MLPNVLSPCLCVLEMPSYVWMYDRAVLFEPFDLQHFLLRLIAVVSCVRPSTAKSPMKQNQPLEYNPIRKARGVAWIKSGVASSRMEIF